MAKTKRSFDGFDFLAPIYDPLTQVVFGNRIRKSQTYFLTRIPARAKVLILGGGTGWLLAELICIKPDCEVWYVELSEKMITLARQKNRQGKVHFITGTMENLSEREFDVVITHYFLDLFSVPTIKKIIPSILALSKPSVLWLAADFVDRGKGWQRILLRFMYLFFNAICQMEATRLPDWESTMLESGLTKTARYDFYNAFIESAVYTKRTAT